MQQTQSVAAITGASGGLGSEICKILAEKRIALVLLERDEAKSRAFVHELSKRQPDVKADVIPVDLSDRDSIARAAAHMCERYARVDYLFNNAGVLPESLQFSRYGTELDFEVNALAPLQLIDGLRPVLAAAKACVVNTTAGLASGVKQLDIETLRKPKTFKKLFGPYTQSKQALNVLTAALGRELAASGVTVRAVDPGPNRTRLTKGGGTPLWMRLFSPLLPGPAVGARRIVDGAFSTRFAGESGVFISGGKIELLPLRLADAAFQREFLSRCRELAQQR